MCTFSRGHLIMRSLTCLALLFCIRTASADGPPQLGWRLDGQAFLRFGEGLETPHTQWAKPCASGKLKVLILANKSGAYDVPELARRLDMDVKGMPADTWLRAGEWYWLALWIESSSYSERMAHFEQMLQHDYDVIVLGNFRFLSLSEAAQYEVLRKVSNGCGLVMFHRHDLDPRLLARELPEVPTMLSRGIPFAGLDFYQNWFMPAQDLLTPEEIGPKLLGAYQFGKGRVLLVDYAEQSSVFASVPGAIAPSMAYDYTAPLRYDYHLSLAARVIQWAARKDPVLAWTHPLPDGLEVEALRPSPPLRIRAAWSGSPDTRLNRRTRVRNVWGEVLQERNVELTAAAGPLEWDIQLPPLPGGWHFVDSIVSSSRGIENWGSFAVDVRPALRIDAVEPTSGFFESDQPITGRVVLSRPAGARPGKPFGSPPLTAGQKSSPPLTAGQKSSPPLTKGGQGGGGGGEGPPKAVELTPPSAISLDITLEDGYGRVFSRKLQPVEPGTDRIPFEIPQGNVASWGVRIRVRLQAGDQTVHQDEAEVRVRRPDRGEYPIAMWGAISGYGNHIGNLQMRDLGFTAVLSGDPLPAARDDIGWMTFGGGRGALIHSLGDEIPIPRPAKGEVLNSFLKTRYGSLEELNTAWGTQFDSWESVEPAYTAKDPTAAGLDNLVQTSGPAGEVRGPQGSLDQQLLRMHHCLSAGEFVFADNIRKKREQIEKDNPPGVVGPEGSPVGDPELTLPEATFWGPYLTDRDNLLVNAVGRPGVLRGNWFGGYVEDRQVPTRNRHRLWMSILGGNNMIEYFTIEGGLLAPDLTLMPFTSEFIPSWQEIRRGLGPQLAFCRPTGNPVALLHSQPSQHIGQAGGDAMDTIKAHEYMLNLLGDAGYSPQYVAAGQVEAGRLRQDDVKVLLLLQASALSDAQIAEIRAFAERGGTVIADLPPAWFDERCRARPNRSLDALFGIAPTSSPLIKGGLGGVTTAEASPGSPPHSEAGQAGSPPLSKGGLGGVTAAGVSPALFRQRTDSMSHVSGVTTDYGPMQLRGLFDSGLSPVHIQSHGQGRAILLGGVIWSDGRHDPQTIQTWRQLLEKAAGVPREFELTWRRPLGKLGTRVYSYARGDIRIDAVLPPEATDEGIPVQPVLTWPDAKHVYDLRQEKYLGELKQLETKVDRSSPVVVARLDYQVGSVHIDAPRAARPGDVLEYTCSIRDTQGRARPGHVIRIQVFGPDGKERPYYGAMLSGEHFEQSGRIPLALNDPAGEWKVRATDVISGVAASATALVSPPALPPSAW